MKRRLVGYIIAVFIGLLCGWLLGRLTSTSPHVASNGGDVGIKNSPGADIVTKRSADRPMTARRTPRNACEAELVEARRALAIMEASLTTPVAGWPASLPEHLQPHTVKASLAEFLDVCQECRGARLDCAEPPCLAILQFDHSPLAVSRANVALGNWADFGGIGAMGFPVETEEGFFLIKAILPVSENESFAARTEERISTLKTAAREGWLTDTSNLVGDGD